MSISFALWVKCSRPWNPRSTRTFQRPGWHASTNQSFPSKGHMKIVWPVIMYLPCVNLFGGSYLCAFDANDAVQTAGWIIEERDADCGTGSRDPRTLRLRINMEHVRLAREDRLLTANTQIIPVNDYTYISNNFELLLVTESRLESIQSEQQRTHVNREFDRVRCGYHKQSSQLLIFSFSGICWM